MIREFIIICPCGFSLVFQRLRLSVSRQILFYKLQKTSRNLISIGALPLCPILLRLQEAPLYPCRSHGHSFTHERSTHIYLCLSEEPFWKALSKLVCLHPFQSDAGSFRMDWKSHVQCFLPVCLCGVNLCSAFWFVAIFIHISNAGPGSEMFWQLRFRYWNIYGVPRYKQMNCVA